MGAIGTHNDTATPASDHDSAFGFTPVNSAPVGDHSEDLCPCAMSHIVSTDKIPLDTAISYLCYRPVRNLILEAGDPIKRVSLFGVRGESAGERDASR